MSIKQLFLRAYGFCGQGFILSAMVLTLFSTQAYATPIVGLLNTGAGSVLNGLDLNYSLSKTGGDNGTGGAIGANGYEGDPRAGSWIANDLSSQWLTPASNGAASFDHSSSGTYTWALQFDLTGFDSSTASFNGRWATDNSGTLDLNGTALANPSGGFSAWSTFNSGNGGFVAGLNTLTFTVVNFVQSFGNPTGLRVEFLASNVETSSVPEPVTSLLLGIGLLGLGLTRRRLRTS